MANSCLRWPHRGSLAWLAALLGIALVLAVWPHAAAAQSAVPLDARGRPLYKAGEVLVQLQPGLGLTSLGSPANRMAATSRPLAVGGRGGTPQVLHLQPGTSVAQAVAQLRNDPAVVAASPNFLNYPLLTTPADAFFGAQWALHNTGQNLFSDPTTPCTTITCFVTGRVAGDDLDAERAWDLSTGTNVIVAVIDTGVDYTHPDLVSQMWDGVGGAGCPDLSGGTTGGSPTLHGGCDITQGNNDPAPTRWDATTTHGTHVAGIIAAQANSAGTVGVAYNAKIMALQVFPDDDVAAGSNYGASDADLITAINYVTSFAQLSGKHVVINMSLGRFGTSTGEGQEDPIMTTAVQNAIAAGVLLVAAAGNGVQNSSGVYIGQNNDDLATQAWPANYAGLASTAAGSISVAATDQADQYGTFSNYGPVNVTIAAPGLNILSTVNTSSVSGGLQGWAYDNGTSMASPMVAGVAALLWGADPSLTPAQVKQRIVDTGDSLPTDACKISSGKRVNAYNALANITTPTPCGAIAALASSGSKGPCLITYLTRPYLADADLNPLRRVRDFLWRQGPWGHTLVRLYYRFSALVVGWLREAGVPTGPLGMTYTI